LRAAFLSCLIAQKHSITSATRSHAHNMLSMVFP
jgi:hypothetical protein